MTATTYCNRAKNQRPILHGFPFSHTWRSPVEGKPAGWANVACYCDKLGR